MKKTFVIVVLLLIVAAIAAIPVVIMSTTKTAGSISSADAEQVINSGMLSTMSENEITQNLGKPDFRIELEDEVHLQYKIKRKTHAFKPAFMIESLCINIDRSTGQPLDVYISD